MPESTDTKQEVGTVSNSSSTDLLAEVFCQTERFDIFKSIVPRREEIGCERMVFQAWFHSEDVPYPACVVTINPANSWFDHYVDWISTHELYRRQGVAREVLEAIQSEIGEIEMDGVTEEGMAFAISFFS